MQLNIIAFVAGIWTLQQQPDLPTDYRTWSLLAAAAAALAWWQPAARASRWLKWSLAKAVWIALGFAWAAFAAHWRLADTLPPQWEGRDIMLVGVVAGLPQPYQRSLRFEFDVERVLTPEARVPRRIVLSWWGSPAREDRPATFPDLHAGERWRLTVRLRRPYGTANPHGFDYEAWLLERGIRATGYVRLKGVNRRLTGLVHQPQYWVESTREAVRERIARALPEGTYAGVLVALAIGDQRAIPQPQWQVFTRTGVNHLMSISGLHVTMVASLAFALAYWGWRRSARLTLALPARKAAALAGLATAFGYALLAGFAVPAQRTVYMLAVVAVALWLGRMSSPSAVLALALFAVTVLDPWAVLAPGFWLSFGAVAVIMFVAAGRIGRLNWLAAWARVQWAVTIGLVPLLLALFQQVSLVSPIANAVAIPVVSLVVVPLTLAGAVFPFDFMLRFAHWIMGWCAALLEWLAAAPEAVWQQHAPPAWAVAAAVPAMFWLLAPRGFPARWLGAIGFLPLFLILPPRIAPGDLRLTVLDVGHGLAVLAQTSNHALLFDAGPSFGPGADSGNRIIVPFLRAAGVRRLDGMIASHDDIDHNGGAISVLQAVPVARFYSSLPRDHPVLDHAPGAATCRSGQRWEWDGVAFEFLHPPAWYYERDGLKDNDLSCVLRISASGGSALLAADIGRSSEEALLTAFGEDLIADVLVVPHHGSRTSSTQEFVWRVNPQVAVFTVGYRNRFGHPKQEVVERYRRLGARLLRTDRDGALTLEFAAGKGIRLQPYRALYRRYWQTPFAGDFIPDPEEL
ncbi:MAG: DNA internalization-related competence protein ComEC/Rec2 [Betaproteobacteria bacterium]|nr:DNA internalization-related competence protein ComEC/Rec2 [Betaproteobacteria bacterium]